MHCEHDNKLYTIDQLCEMGVITALRRYIVLPTANALSRAVWFADESEHAGWEISEDLAVYLHGKYDLPMDIVH